MLFIYSALALGGIETFFVRMARERYGHGLVTKILLLRGPEKSDPELLQEMRRYAEIYFVKDVFYGFPAFSSLFPLIAPVKKQKIRKIFAGISQVHAFSGVHVLLGYRLAEVVNARVPVTVGFYHYLRYAWGGIRLPYHEIVNRKFIFNYLPKPCLLFFSDDTKKFYERYRGESLEGSKTFRLGVVDQKNVFIDGGLKKPLKIVTVGRFVDFKTYNLYMLRVVRSLLDQGKEVIFDLYGYGPLKPEMEALVQELNLQSVVSFKGPLPYSQFDDTVCQYDLFVGSGTAIIQASALGVPSIVGVENTLQPKTYGYFSDIYHLEYNMKGLSIPMKSVEDLVSEHLSLDRERVFELKNRHVQSAEVFTNELCQCNFDRLKNVSMPLSQFRYSRIFYTISWFFDKTFAYLNASHPFSARNDNF